MGRSSTTLSPCKKPDVLPPIVTFWHGRLDRLRLLCLASQVAAGHKVTVYSFEPLAGLPEGVGNAEAEAVLPRSFAERLRPSGADGAWRDCTTRCRRNPSTPFMPSQNCSLSVRIFRR